MADLIWILLSGFAGLVAGSIIMEVFRWGYNKEHNNKNKK